MQSSSQTLGSVKNLGIDPCVQGGPLTVDPSTHSSDRDDNGNHEDSEQHGVFNQGRAFFILAEPFDIAKKLTHTNLHDVSIYLNRIEANDAAWSGPKHYRANYMLNRRPVMNCLILGRFMRYCD